MAQYRKNLSLVLEYASTFLIIRTLPSVQIQFDHNIFQIIGRKKMNLTCSEILDINNGEQM